MSLPLVGQPGPDFTLPSTSGADLTLSSLRGRNVLLAFFPLAFTSTCTTEMCAFTDDLEKFSSADTVIRRNADALAKGELNIHATLTIPKGKFHPRFANVPDVDSLAKNDKERQLITLFREFMYPRWPYVLSPGTPPEIVKTLREAMSKSFKDPGFAQEFKKLMGGEPSPLTGEEVEASIRQLPRDPEIVGLYKQMAQHGPLPPR